MRNPEPHDYYAHKNGETVQVLSVAFNRVTFVREGSVWSSNSCCYCQF
ncbi:DUF4222 domain-containing protein [Xenorhabdus sp. PB61.4]|nr:DUF4222 domain-containing protein [Xenorhabdus sp. PB61.4]MCC8367965.1 DUF4222 domain-containing protein [Xenorhabdus sp. PB61.4]